MGERKEDGWGKGRGEKVEWRRRKGVLWVCGIMQCVEWAKEWMRYNIGAWGIADSDLFAPQKLAGYSAYGSVDFSGSDSIARQVMRIGLHDVR